MGGQRGAKGRGGLAGCCDAVRSDDLDGQWRALAAVLLIIDGSEVVVLGIRLGVAARRLVDERFSADLIGRATVDLYRRLVES